MSLLLWSWMEHHVYLYNTSWGRVELLSPVLQVGTHVQKASKLDTPRISAPDCGLCRGTPISICQDVNSVMHPTTEQEIQPLGLRSQPR